VRGPHSTPLVAGNHLISVGTYGQLKAFDKGTGNVAWSHELWREWHGTRLERGYSSSPLAYQNLVIVTVGGPKQALIAFERETGAVVWRAQTFRLSPSSPMLIKVDGQDQIVLATADHVHGIDPRNGELLWQHSHPCGGFNITPPVWGPDNVLIISSAYSCGTRALRLSQADGKTSVKELWFTSRMRVHHGTLLRVGDMLVGSSGNVGPAPLTAVDVKTGRILWQDRTFPKANLVHADGMLIVLDENGQLALARVALDGLVVVSRADVMEQLSWTPPTLVGPQLYVRDRRTIAAFDLK
jgi:outer membrane protein assembly factor BamB